MSSFSLPQRKDDTFDETDLYSKVLTTLATGVDFRRLHTVPKFEAVSRDLLNSIQRPEGSSPCCVVSRSICSASSFVTVNPFLKSLQRRCTSSNGRGGWIDHVPYYAS